MATAEIAAAMASIPSKKAELRVAFDALQSFSSSLASFTLKWQDLEDHFAALERSIEDRLRDLEAKSRPAPSTPLVAVKAELDSGADAMKAEEAAVDAKPLPETRTPRPELRSFCVNMDGLGLRSYLVANRKEIAGLRAELGPAVGLAPDPAKLVLDAMDGFYRPKAAGEKDGELQVTRRTCLSLLEQLQQLAPEVSDSVRNAAKKVAEEWKGKITDGGENATEALALLQLLLVYRLVPEFELDEVMELFVLVSRRKQALDLCKSLGLVEHMPDLIQKLKNKGRQLDAVKFIHALGFSEKYPLVPLLKIYLKDSKRAAQDMLKRGNNSAQSQNDSIVKELSAIRTVIKAVEEYKLESQYPCENLKKRIVQLEQQKAQKKRPASAAVANSKPRKQHQQQSNKRPRPSTSSTLGFATHPRPPLAQNHSQLGLADQPRYMGLIGSYGLSTGALYDAPIPSIAGANYGATGSRSPGSYLYSSQSVAGPGLYDRPATYGSYSASGLPDPYGSFYPRV